MQDDNLFVVVRNASNKDQLLKYSIKMDANTFAIAENRVHLDHLMKSQNLFLVPTQQLLTMLQLINQHLLNLQD